MKKRLHWILPTVFSAWVGISLLILFLVGDALPIQVTNGLSLSFLLFLPFLPVLRQMGLATGVDAYSGPTPLGFLICVAFYDFILFLLGRWMNRKIRRG